MQLRKIQAQISGNSSFWDQAIQDAERKLKRTDVRSKRLRAAIETFKAHKKMGKSWPGQAA